MRQDALLHAPTVVEYDPKEQFEQLCVGYIMYSPGWQDVQFAEDIAPSLNECDPSVQFTHVLIFGAPTVVEYVPAVQLAHACDGYSMYCPALQVWHAADDDAPA